MNQNHDIGIPTEKLVEILLWILFFAAFVPVSDNAMSPDIKRLLYYSSYIGGMSLIALSLRHIYFVGEYARMNSGYWLIFSMGFVCFFGTLLGLAVGGPNVLKALVFESLLPYSAFVLMLLPTQQKVREVLVKTFVRQVFAAALISAIAIWHTFHSNPMDILNRAIWYEGYECQAFRLLHLLPFMAGYVIAASDRKNLLIIIFGYIMYVVMSVRGMNRAPILLAAVIIPASVFAVYWKSNSVSRFIAFLGKLAILVCVLAMLFRIAAPSLISGLALDISALKLMYRFTGTYEMESKEVKSGVESAMEREINVSRGAEARDFLNSLEFLDCFLGKGFGISWYSSFWKQDWGIVHIGPLHLMLRGGILFVATYYLLFWFAVKTSWKYCEKNPVAMGCFVYMISWIAMFHSYGPQIAKYPTYIFWLVVGLSLSFDVSEHREPRCGRHAK